VAGIPVPALNKPKIPPAYNAAPALLPFPAPVFPTPRQLPVIPLVSDLVLHSYIHYATGQPQVEDDHLRASKSPLPILVSDIPSVVNLKVSDFIFILFIIDF
jgi:hypothetical protein